MSVSEAVQYLGVARRTVYRLIENGEIQAVKLGPPGHICKNSLERFRESENLT